MLRLVFPCLLLLVLPPSPPDDVKVVRDKNNVLSSRIEGRWEADPTLWERMQPHGKATATFAFRTDATVIERLPGWFREKAAELVVYAAGVATIDGKEYPCVVTSSLGNPTLVYFRERDGDPMGDGESNLAMLAPARDTAQDVLFLGGDFNNEPFRPFRRVKE
jgi:hypothetical protein